MSEVSGDVYGALPKGYESAVIGSPAAQDVSMLDYILSIVLCLAALMIAVAVNSKTLHWCVVPCFFCGVMMGADCIAALLGRLEIFDPKAMIGFAGLHFFYISVLMFVAGDMEMPFVLNPDDWRPWLGIMGFLNLIGLILYRLGSWIAERGVSNKPRTTWVPNQYAIPVFTVFLFISLAIQLLVFIKFGGLRGLLTIRDEDVTAMVGWTIPRLIGSSVTLLAFILVILLRARKDSAEGGGFGVMVLLGFLVVVQFAMAGYSRSRGNVVVPIFWILGIVHYFWRPIKAKFFIFMVIVSFPLLVVFTFYKSLGSDVVSLWKAYGSMDVLMDKSKRSPAGVLIGDLARTDIHAYLIYKMKTFPDNYDLRYGETYYTCWTQVVPRELWRNRPTAGSKVLAGTEIVHGKGYYRPHTKRRSTRTFGLSGEAILNFGVWSAPIPFLLWGWLIGRLRRYLRDRPIGDLRLLCVPYLVWEAVNALYWDVDNHLAQFLTRASITMLAVWISSSKVPYVSEEQEELGVEAGE